MFYRISVLWIVFLSSLLAASSGQCDLIVGNLAASTNDNGALVGFETSVGYSIGFNVGVSPLILTDVALRLRGNTGSGQATLQLRSDVGGNPNSTALASFGNQTVSTSFGTVSFMPTATLQLTANTNYWLTIGTTMNAPNGLIIGSNEPSNAPIGALASFSGLRSGFINDQSFDISGLVNTPTFAINGNVAAVPEPSSIVLFMIAPGMIIWYRKRRDRKLGSLTAQDLNR